MYALVWLPGIGLLLVAGMRTHQYISSAPDCVSTDIGANRQRQNIILITIMHVFGSLACRRHATQLEDRLLRSQEQQQQADQSRAAAEEGMPTAAAAAKIAALQSELAASQAALLKLEQELTSQQYRVEVRLRCRIAVFLLRKSTFFCEARAGAEQPAVESGGAAAVLHCCFSFADINSCLRSQSRS
jgi:hypothetical protein